ncbi:VOC family protein [Arcobacteraceae bacterium]|nr:VOC family protein [Arcobacteraceae bacterium]
MEITINHTIVNSKNNIASAKFYEKIFGFKYIKEWGHFAVVQVNSTLTLDFLTKEKFSKQHYAFKVSEKEFDEIFSKIKSENLPYGSGPYSRDDGKINHNNDGRGVYFPDPSGHILEIITQDYDIGL